jgi:hypothetical protein
MISLGSTWYQVEINFPVVYPKQSTTVSVGSVLKQHITPLQPIMAPYLQKMRP